MTSSQQLQHGDVVVHPRRPEWGRGVVKEATWITYRGTPAQRVAVQFANKGRVVINTAVAPLVASDAGPASPPPTEPLNASSPSDPSASASTMHQSPSSANAPTNPDAGWLNDLERGRRQGHAALTELPEAMTDPFLPLHRRLEATLESYRFTDAPRSLIDWAVAQTGYDDPLSHYTRHELEEAFVRFRHQRDRHLQSLVRTIKQKGESSVLTSALRTTRHDAARNALRKLMR